MSREMCRVNCSGFASIELLISGLLLSGSVLMALNVQMLALRVAEAAKISIYAGRQLDELIELVALSPDIVCTGLNLNCAGADREGIQVSPDTMVLLMNDWQSRGDLHLAPGWLQLNVAGDRLLMAPTSLDGQALEISRRWPW